MTSPRSDTPLAARVVTRSRKPVSPAPLGAIVPRVRPYAGRLAVCAVCLVVAAAVGLAFPRVVQHLLDAAFEKGDRGLLDRIALGLILAFALQGAMNFVQVYLLTGTSERVIAKLREDVFAHLVHLSPGFFTDRRTGELTSRLSADLAVLQTLLGTWISESSRQVLFLVGGVAMLTITHPRLTTTTLAVVPVVVGAAFFFGRRLRRASTGLQDRIAESMGMADEAFAQIRTVQSFVREDEEARRYHGLLAGVPVVVGAAFFFGKRLRRASTGLQDRIAESMGMADEAFSQIRTVQSFVRENEEARRYHGLLAGVVTAAVQRAKMRATLFGVVGFIAFAGVVAVLWQGGRLVLEGALTPGALVSFLLYAITVAAAVGSLASLFGSYQEAVGAAQRVFELLDMQPTVAEPERPTPLRRPVRGAVALDRVAFRYAPDLPEVLSDVTLSIAPGEVVALVGPSGAGKTTVASLIPRFWDVTGGRITLDGVDVRELSFADLRGSIGLVPQEPALFSGSVRDNIAYARPDASDADVHAAARAAHALEFIDRLPDGMATRVGERGIKLSGGQRQRIALARVFLKDPAVVVLDEATSSLDNESERLVEEAMEELLRGRSTLIIAHRLRTVRRADRVLVLERGQVVEEGTHEELVGQSGLYGRLYQAELRD